MIIIGLAGKNRISKGACALHLNQRRDYLILPPDFADGAEWPRAFTQAWLRCTAKRLVIADVVDCSAAAVVRAAGGIIVHIIAARDPDHETAADIHANDFVVHGYCGCPQKMFEQLDRIVIDHELQVLTEARKHATA